MKPLVLFFLIAPLMAQTKIITGLTEPFSLVFDKSGNAYGVEYEKGNRIFKVENGKVTFIVGSKTPGGKKLGDVASGDGGPPLQARFNGMHDLTLHPDGRLFIADTFNRRIRVLDLKTNTLSTLGNGKLKLKLPHTVDLHPDGNHLLISDLERRQILELNLTTHALKVLAGTGKKGLPKDLQPATEQPLLAPRAAIYGPAGKTIYLASREGHALRHIDEESRIKTLVNRSGKKGSSGDNGPGIEAKLNGPKHLALDPQGNIVITDDNNHTLRLYKIKEQTLHLLHGHPGKKGDSPKHLNRPHGARYAPDGSLWIADSFNHRLLILPPKR